MGTMPRSALHVRIGQRVRELRRALQLTQAALAARVGCSNHFISGFERAVDSPSLLTLESLAGALGTTVAYLVQEEPEGESLSLAAIARSLRGKSDPRLLHVLRELAELYEPSLSKPRKKRPNKPNGFLKRKKV